MKYKVKVIAISLKGNKVARCGQVIDHEKLAGDHKQLLLDGYLEHTKESEASWAAEEKAKKEAKKAAHKQVKIDAKAKSDAKKDADDKAKKDAKAKSDADAKAKADDKAKQ